MRSFAAHLALGVGALVAALAPPSRAAVPWEDPARALARVDSLQAIVRDEESRLHQAQGREASWARLARAWFQVGDHAKAAKCLERARMLGAREFDTQLLSGRVARSEARFAEAVEWMQRAVRMKPEDWEAHEDLGLALYLAGRYPEAADHWDRARALPGSGAPDRSAWSAALRRAGAGAYRISGPGRERIGFAAGSARGGIVVPVRVAGRGPFPMRLDMGSPEVVLDRALALELGLAVIAGGEVGSAAGDRGARFDYAVIDSLSLGGTTLHALPVAVSDHPALGAAGVRGTLGFEVLRRFRFVVDFPDSTLWLEPAGVSADTTRPGWAPAGRAAHRVPVLLRGTHLLVAYGRLNQGPERPFLLDAANPGVGLVAPMSTLVEAGIRVDTTRVATGRLAAGPVSYHPFDVGRLCLGNACRDSLRGVYGVFPSRLELNPNFRLAGNLGHGFLSGYRLAVDLGRREAWLIEP